MDSKQAKELVKKLIDIAYEAGFQHNSKMIWNCRESNMILGDEIIHHLTSRSSRAAECCVLCGRFRKGKCGLDLDLKRKFTPPRYDEVYFRGQKELLDNN